MLPHIDQANNATADEFIHAANTLFETAPPLAKLLCSGRPYASWTEVILRAESWCRPTEGCQFTDAELVEIINAHPRLGAPKATLSALSLKEQGYSANSSEDEDAKVNAALQRLNEQYEGKFCFKFVVFVNGRPRKDLIPVIQERLDRDKATELATGLSEMMAIAKDRLKKLGQS